MPPAAIGSDIVAQLSADSNSLLDTIDALWELGVSNFVDLPQIIVVGDQSSGKSSVLEAIWRLRFPVDGDICTRFATELVLRRAPGSETTANVSIQFANQGQGHDARPPFKRTTFDREKLADLIKEAKEAMGIGSGGGKQFSKDILRIEVTGPDVPPVTLVDLPGIFHSATADQDGRGREIVNQLIDSYMRQSKSIILAVVSAGQQLAGQAVLDKAVEHDPKRERTIGVITKPDTAGRQNGRKYLDLAKGREPMHRLSLGWYVLRNPSEEERASSAAAARDAAEEAFFRAGDWSAISPANRGVESLRKRLSRVLLDHIRSSLPELIANIDRHVGDRKRELGRLGAPRSTAEALRSYLGGVANTFQLLATAAVEGRYRYEFFGELNQRDMRARKLRAVLGNMHLAFEVVMETKGACYEIGSSDSRDEDYRGGDTELDEAVDNGEHKGGNNFDDETFGASHPDHVQELVDGYDVGQPEPKSVKSLSTELEAGFNRGKEFPGDVNPDLVFLLLKKQTSPWKAIAQQHLDSVLGATRQFVEQLFVYILGPDEDTLTAILATYVDGFFDEKKDELEVKLAELLRPYVNGYALPREREARERMRRVTSERGRLQLAAHLRENHENLFGAASPGGHFRVTLDQVISAVREPERRERSTSGIEVVINKVTVQYEMFRETFIENVINLVVESCLVHHIPDILTTGKVDRMTVDELKELASESEDIQVRRSDLEAEVKILEEGLRKCQRHKPRSLADNAPTPRNNAAATGAARSAATPGSGSEVSIPSGGPRPPSTAAAATTTTGQANGGREATTGPGPEQRGFPAATTTPSTSSDTNSGTSSGTSSTNSIINSSGTFSNFAPSGGPTTTTTTTATVSAATTTNPFSYQPTLSTGPGFFGRSSSPIPPIGSSGLFSSSNNNNNNSSSSSSSSSSPAPPHSGGLFGNSASLVPGGGGGGGLFNRSPVPPPTGSSSSGGGLFGGRAPGAGRR